MTLRRLEYDNGQVNTIKLIFLLFTTVQYLIGACLSLSYLLISVSCLYVLSFNFMTFRIPDTITSGTSLYDQLWRHRININYNQKELRRIGICLNPYIRHMVFLSYEKNNFIIICQILFMTGNPFIPS